MQLDGENQCLKAAQDCGLYEKCGSLRSEYVLACTKKVPGTNQCNQQKCHRTLRRFLERVPEEYSLPVLFCPCTSTLCGERRRKNIVPSCSYQQIEGPLHNCLQQQNICRQDDLCRWNWHYISLLVLVFNVEMKWSWRINDTWCTVKINKNIINKSVERNLNEKKNLKCNNVYIFSNFCLT